MDVQPELGTFSKWNRKTQRDHSFILSANSKCNKKLHWVLFSFLHTAAELQLYLDFFSTVIRRRKSYYSSIYQFRHENENVYLLLLQRLSA